MSIEILFVFDDAIKQEGYVVFLTDERQVSQKYRLRTPQLTRIVSFSAVNHFLAQRGPEAVVRYRILASGESQQLSVGRQVAFKMLGVRDLFLETLQIFKYINVTS